MSNKNRKEDSTRARKVKKSSLKPVEIKLSKKKQILFSMIMIIIPIIFLIGLELILRAFNYGNNVDLIIKRKIDNETYCYVNKKVARRFFSYQDSGVPDAKLSVFPEKKEGNAYRIFCMGGSTTAGFPYQFNATFPSLVKDRLDNLFPDKEIEVINMGISAINSYSVLDFTKELVKYDPDLFLIYMGHNEFYGALGVGSTQQIGQNRSWVLFYMKLQKSKTFQMLHDFVSWLKRSVSDHSATQNRNRTLMQQVVKDQVIELNSKEYDIAKGYFKENLREIVQIAKKRNARVILSTLVSNLSDQEPFSHYFSELTTDFQKEEWNEVYKQGIQYESQQKFGDALKAYRTAALIDKKPPVLHFRRGKCLQALRQIDPAKSEFKLAKDHDAIRFRASEEFNEIIREIAYTEAVPVIDMEKIFEPYCRDFILGRALFTDHLHPNFPGYFWMAKGFVDAMSQNDILVPKDEWPWQRDKKMKEYREIAAVTDLEQEIANQRIRRLTSQWPYKQEIVLRKNSGNEYDKLIETTARDFFAMKLGWNEAHYKIADYFIKNEQIDRAINEYQAVIKVTPYNYFPYIELGDLYMRKNELDSAEKVFKDALQYSPHLPYAYAKLGMLYYFMHKRDQSVEKLESAIRINNLNRKFTNNELAIAYYILSMAYGEKGEIEKAKEMINKSIQLNPNDQKAKYVLETLNNVN